MELDMWPPFHISNQEDLALDLRFGKGGIHKCWIGVFICNNNTPMKIDKICAFATADGNNIKDE